MFYPSPHELMGGGQLNNETANRFRILERYFFYFKYPGFCFRFLFKLRKEYGIG